MSPRRVVVRAPAKVNLSLRVLGRRADGYHEVDTLLLALDLWDRVEVRLAEGPEPTLRVTGPASDGVPRDGSNLALRAARAALALARATGRPAAGLELSLEKHVPAAAGLGGGSSDAAAALLGSALLLDLDPAHPDLARSLAELGSDCAFFYEARATGLARCTGRGERVQPLPVPGFPWAVVLVTPGFGCGTAEVYRAHRAETLSAEPRPSAATARLDATLAEVRGHLVNELEPAALRSCPGLAEVRELLAALEPGAFLLSGSGSSFFGLFADEGSAQGVLRRVRAESEARRCALRGSWVLRAAGRGVQVEDSTSQIDAP